MTHFTYTEVSTQICRLTSNSGGPSSASSADCSSPILLHACQTQTMCVTNSTLPKHCSAQLKQKVLVHVPNNCFKDIRLDKKVNRQTRRPEYFRKLFIMSLGSLNFIHLNRNVMIYLKSQTLSRRSVPLEAKMVSLWGDHCTCHK